MSRGSVFCFGLGALGLYLSGRLSHYAHGEHHDEDSGDLMHILVEVMVITSACDTPLRPQNLIHNRPPPQITAAFRPLGVQRFDSQLGHL